MKKIIFILLMVTTSIFAQKQINNYKYVIVPNKFDFVKENDQYQTSSLTKFLFNKHGFTVFFSDDILPDEIAKNRCLALNGIVKSNSSMFTTKIITELRDCSGKIIFSSKEGKSKAKDYKKAYHEAIRKSFESIASLKYQYEPAEITAIKKPSVTKNLKVFENKIMTTKDVKTKTLISLYAQSTINGYQLVNTKPEVVLQILKTNVKDVFILEGKNGILYKNNNIWIAEYYKNGVKVLENFQIKF